MAAQIAPPTRASNGDTAPKRKNKSPEAQAKANPRSAKLAIAAFCYHSCMSEDRVNAHNTKLDIRDCANEACHLWPHRPWQNMKNRANSARDSDD